ICLSTYVSDNAMTTSRARADLAHGDTERLTGRKPASHDRRAVGPNDDAMRGPAGCRKVEGRGANVRLQLGRSATVVEPERLGVDRPAPNKNGQATPGPAVLVESCIDIYDQILSQAFANLPIDDQGEPRLSGL